MADALALLEWQGNGLVPIQNKLANFVASLQNQVPTKSAANIPIYYIDPTAIAECLPFCETTDDIPEKTLEQAQISIGFDEGYPTVDGIPIWERLDGEKIDYYKLFKEYRDMKYYNDTHLNQRSIAKLAENLDVPGKLLTILSKIYHWSFRTKAFDIYKNTELQIKKQRIAEELEQKHAKYSNEILEQAITYLKNHPEKLDPKVALDMIQMGMKYGRISVGLLGDKPGASSGTVAHQTNIQIAQSTTTNNQSVENGQLLTINAQDNNFGDADGNSDKKIEQQFSNGLKNNGTMASILHVLNKSGAFKEATDSKNDETNDEIIDVTP